MASCMSYGSFEVKYDDIIEEMLIPEQEMLIKLKSCSGSLGYHAA